MTPRLEKAIRELAEAQLRYENGRHAIDSLASSGFQTEDHRRSIIAAAWEAEDKREVAIKAVVTAWGDEPK